MATARLDLLALDRGLVIAPAGCGKTQLIADALTRHSDAKPVLILTHTNAGVVALRARLERAGVSPSRYRLMTLDGWALRVATTFPARSGLPAVLPATLNYPKIRVAAIRLLNEGHINDVIRASYSRVLVDEYQDCSLRQHAIVYLVADLLPTCVLGDPLQAIFSFSADDPLADWDKHVCDFFPIAGELDRPWRWINAGNESLGEWLLAVRRDLLAGRPIDLRGAPDSVEWVQLYGTPADQALLVTAMRKPTATDNSRVLIIGNSRNASSRHQLARNVPGTTVVEPVDFRDMVHFLGRLDLNAVDALGAILQFAETVMTGVGTTTFLARIRSLTSGTARTRATPAEAAAVSFLEERSPRSVAALWSSISAQAGVRVFRPAVLRGGLRALQLAESDSTTSIGEAAIRIREEYRLLGRPLPRRAIGSTLLLKGLEAESVVILDSHDHDARNLYVALTRASRTIIVCSRSATLNPAL